MAHRKSKFYSNVGLDPTVKANIESDGSVTTTFTFEGLPEMNWFRVNIVNGVNAIVDSIDSIADTVFPPDISTTMKEEQTNQNQADNYEGGAHGSEEAE